MPSTPCDLVNDDPVAQHNQTWLSTADVSSYTGLAIPTLKKYRGDGTGPDYAKVGTRIIYRRQDIDRWLESHLVGRPPQ